MQIRHLLKLATVNAVVLVALLAAGSLALRGINYLQQGSSGNASPATKAGFNGKTIRASLPTYSSMEPEYAKAIFSEMEAVPMRYTPFTGWSMGEFSGKAANVEGKHSTRLSTNHQVDDSVWFLGGSTMWGVGADDSHTIPSLYAVLSGDKVWNLGQGGHNSFQEFVRLSELLATGLKPRLVVIYDGTNEGLYCSANNHLYPTHSRAQIWEERIREFPKLKREYEALKEQKGGIGQVPVFAKLGKAVRSTISFFARPYLDLYRRGTDKRILGRPEPQHLKSDTPFNKIRPKAHYLSCDTSAEKREIAARTTVETWLMANDLLKSRGIELKIFLQPTARIGPETLNLDYILNIHKQRIADTAASYQAQYKAIKDTWLKSCAAHDACDAFHDISDIFNGSPDPIYIDETHLGHQGNAIVAGKIHATVRTEASASAIHPQ